MFKWLFPRGASRSALERELAGLTPVRWQSVLAEHVFLAGLSSAESEALRQRTAWVLASKAFTGVQGLQVTDYVRQSVAVQAALPIMHLDVGLYAGWTEIILYPGGFLIPRIEVDEAGVVHEYMQEASGEAWEGGPVVLSWEDARPGQADECNVVIHEFVHKLDGYGGDYAGVPALSQHPGISQAAWCDCLEASYAAFCQALDAIEQAIPDTVDPESPQGQAWFEALPMDPYAATDTAEFFAVSSEVFFVHPAPLAEALPDWYDMLRRYYRQDPVHRLACL